MNVTVIGIFDLEADLESALKALTDAGFDHGAFEIIDGVRQDHSPPPAAGPAVIPGIAPDADKGGLKASRGTNQAPHEAHAVEQALARAGLTNEEIALYVRGVSGNSRLLLGYVPQQRAAEAAEIMREAGVERVSLHANS